MDFPLFHLDFFGNRLLIGVIAVIHVFASHPLAVGILPLITVMEWWGYRKKDPRWDRLAYSMLAVCFISATSIGALTGVGIWFSSSLTNPYAIGSLIRVFFWAWFAEWLVFVAELLLILIYFLTWKRWGSQNKRRHIRLGIALSAMSWVTMMIITAILAFMLESGVWPERRAFFLGYFNPAYLPQLLFRTTMAMIGAGLFAWFLAFFFTRGDEDIRRRSVRLISLWVLAWSPWWALAALASWWSIPDPSSAKLSVALATQAYAAHYEHLAWAVAAALAAVGAVVLWAVLLPGSVPRFVLLVPFLLSLALMGYFERVREFVRKPYVIDDYMYANGIREREYALLRSEGVLAHATYVPSREINERNQHEVGRSLFVIACSRCHTTAGVNGVNKKLAGLLGNDPWDAGAVKNYLRSMHNTRPFMPPVPGTDQELGVLVDYLVTLQYHPVGVQGAQLVGAVVPPEITRSDTIPPSRLP